MDDSSAYRDVMNAVAMIRAAKVAREQARRTILCEPHREHQIRAAVDQAGAADIFTVRASPACPEGQLLLIPEDFIDTAQRAALERLEEDWRMSP